MLVILAGDDDENGNEDGEKSEKEESKSSPSLVDYILHCLSLFWKLLFAFVPPTGQSNLIN